MDGSSTQRSVREKWMQSTGGGELAFPTCHSAASQWSCSASGGEPELQLPQLRAFISLRLRLHFDFSPASPPLSFVPQSHLSPVHTLLLLFTQQHGLCGVVEIYSSKMDPLAPRDCVCCSVTLTCLLWIERLCDWSTAAIRILCVFVFILLLFPLKVKKKGLNATRWCEHSDHWSAHTYTCFYTLPHKHTHTQTQVSPHQWCCLLIPPQALTTRLPSERWTPSSRWCSRMPRRMGKHLWISSIVTLLTINAWIQ